MEIVIGGKNDISVKATKFLIENFGKANVGVLPNKGDTGKNHWQKSLLKQATNLNIQIYKDISELYQKQDMIFISLEFDKIVKPRKFKSQKLFNIHFSLLPKYKGVYTSAWPILNGEKYSGVTLHKIDKGIDTGDIIGQMQFPIDLGETARSLYLKYNKFAFELFKKYISSIIEDRFLQEKQSKINSTYFSKKSIDYGNLRINLNKTAYEIDCQVRAFCFREYQMPRLIDKNIYKTVILDKKSNRKPGTVIKEDNEKITISTIDYDCELYIDYFDELLQICQNGDLKTAKNIVSYVPNIHEKSKEGWSPIIVAAYFNNLEVLKFLVSKGANVNDVNYNNTSVIMYAKDGVINSDSKDPKILQFLMAHGADPYQKDCTGKDLFDYIEGTKYEYLLKYIL